MGGSGGSLVLGSCTLMADDCPDGYTCACGGPGGLPQCQCHKDCTRDEDCGGSGYTCGCAPNAEPRVCVNACFCLCG